MTDTKKRVIRAIEIEKYYTVHPESKNDYPEISNIFLGIKFDRPSIKKRITDRLHERLKKGMVEEVQNLLNEGLKPEDLIYYGLEYKYITQYIEGGLDYDIMVEKLNIAIQQFAKRQMTWYRKMEREGAKIPPEPPDPMVMDVAMILQSTKRSMSHQERLCARNRSIAP